MDFAGLLVLAALPFINWPVALFLVRLARRKPAIRALEERAGLAVLIASVTTAYAVASLNFNAGVLDFDMARTLIRGAIVVLGLYPLVWFWAYWTDRFRDPSGEGDLDPDDATRELRQGGERPVVEVDQPFPVGSAVALAPVREADEDAPRA